MKYVLAYQLRGTAEMCSIPIPKDKEHDVDERITALPEDKKIKFNDGLVLYKDEIYGVMTEGEFYTFCLKLDFPVPKKGPGHAEWLELGEAIIHHEPLTKWKRKTKNDQQSQGVEGEV